MREPPLSNAADNTGIIVLAAGASTRMGTPKQLLSIAGIPMIRRVAQNAIDSKFSPVIVVLGPNAELICRELRALKIKVVVNPEWESGLSSSIRCGLKTLLAMAPEIEGVILMLADQPNITGDSLQRFIQVKNDSCLIAAHYENTLGTPAFFPHAYFGELLQLKGKGGAKSILERHRKKVLAIDLPEAALDIDTPRDFAAFSKGAGNQP
jgi:molybdenum cofactor cytidylyltransferase